MNPSVAIVILNWNGKPFLEKYLPSVVATTYSNHSLYVIDNASTDESLVFLQHFYPGIRIISNSGNYGFAKGYNEGLKAVEADYFVLLNSDVEVEPDWIEPVIEWMEREPELAACQPKLLQYTDKNSFEYAGAAGGWIDQLGYPFVRGRVFDVCEKDQGQFAEKTRIGWASGAAFFVRANRFREAGGFDPFFFAHMEEIDLCWRLQLAGYGIGYCPESVVYHLGGGTLPKGNHRKVFLNYRNNLIMLAKNLPVVQAAWVIPFRFGLDALSAWKSLFGGDLTYFKAVIQAHFAFFGWWLGSKKESLRPLKKGLPKAGYYRGSIVWQYFVRGRKTFAEIMR